MNFIGIVEDEVCGTIQLWEMKDEPSEKWNDLQDDSNATENETAERS